MPETLAQVQARFRRNLARARNMLEVYEEAWGPQSGQGSGRRSVDAQDFLRASVVFLHASLDDLLRSIAVLRLPLSASAEVLDQIPLVNPQPGTPPSGQKFSFSKLAPHRGKTIDQILRESIEAHYSKESFNNTADIAGLLEAIDVDVGAVNSRFGELSEMMTRRHHIVHQADRNPRAGRGQHSAQAIHQATVRQWADAVEEFGNVLLGELT